MGAFGLVPGDKEAAPAAFTTGAADCAEPDDFAGFFVTSLLFAVVADAIGLVATLFFDAAVDTLLEVAAAFEAVCEVSELEAELGRCLTWLFFLP